MKINNVNKSTIDFFRKNAKKWACIGVTAFMIASPTKGKSETNQQTDFSSPIKIEHRVKQTIEIDNIQDINVEDFGESVRRCIEQSTIMNGNPEQQLEISFLYYGPWEVNESGNYVRTISSVVPNIDYFLSNDYNQLLDDIKNDKNNDFMLITEIKTETSEIKPETYDNVYLEIGDGDLLISSKVNRPYLKKTIIMLIGSLVVSVLYAMLILKLDRKLFGK